VDCACDPNRPAVFGREGISDLPHRILRTRRHEDQHGFLGWRGLPASTWSGATGEGDRKGDEEDCQSIRCRHGQFRAINVASLTLVQILMIDYADRTG